VNEITFVEKLRRYSKLIGDDCAVVPSPRNRDLLFTTDFTIEGVHFKQGSAAEDLGRRALARSLSDIAAMGGVPRYCLVSVALGPKTTERWLDGFYRGLNKLLRKHRVALAGGDLSHANQFVCEVMLCGEVPQDKALRRDGARRGDLIYVSGALGGWRHKPVIVPRLDIGRKLIGKATACIDISDGLALDLFRLCRASGVAAELDSIPLLKGATLAQALHDGEDYELLYTAPPKTRVPGTRIGVIRKGKPGAITLQGKPIEHRGYDHFLRKTGDSARNHHFSRREKP